MMAALSAIRYAERSNDHPTFSVNDHATTILAIGLPLALYPDVGASYYTQTAPQVTNWADEISAYQAEQAKHGEHAESAETPAPAHAE